MTQAEEIGGEPVTRGHGVPLGEAVRTWARISALSFGGPAGQIAVMHRILVEEKRWLGEDRFLHALNYCMLLPGPEAQQLAVYVGWLMHRTAGGLIAGILFVLPGMLAIMALSWIYVLFGNAGLVQALFFGLKAAVLAVVLDAVVRIGGRALRNRVMVGIAAFAFVAIFAFGAPFPAIVLAAGLIGLVGGHMGAPSFRSGAGHGTGGGRALADEDSLLGAGTPAHARPTRSWMMGMGGTLLALWLAPTLALVLMFGTDDTFPQIAVFFSQMAVVTFGGAYAVLAYVAQQAVETYGWLRPGEMLDGLGMAETTPGPLIMVTQFVGFMGAFRDPGPLSPLLAGTLGGLLTTWVTFVPCFLWIFLGAPFAESLRGNRALSAGLSAITAAVVGVILNLAVWFALHVLFREVREVRFGPVALDVPVLASVDPVSLALTTAAFLAAFRFKVGMIPLLAGCSAAGMLVHLAAGHAG